MLEHSRTLHLARTAFISFVWLSERTANPGSHCLWAVGPLNLLVSIIDMFRFYSAVELNFKCCLDGIQTQKQISIFNTRVYIETVIHDCRLPFRLCHPCSSVEVYLDTSMKAGVPLRRFCLSNISHGIRSGAVGWYAVLQTGRSRVRFRMGSLGFLIDLILPAALWPWGYSSCNAGVLIST